MLSVPTGSAGAAHGMELFMAQEASYKTN